jgi:hypothetical protein
MRRVCIVVLAFFALGFIAFAAMSAVEGHDTLSSLNLEDSRSPINRGVFTNAALATVFAAGALAVGRSRPERR